MNKATLKKRYVGMQPDIRYRSVAVPDGGVLRLFNFVGLLLGSIFNCRHKARAIFCSWLGRVFVVPFGVGIEIV